MMRFHETDPGTFVLHLDMESPPSGWHLLIHDSPDTVVRQVENALEAMDLEVDRVDVAGTLFVLARGWDRSRS